MKSLLLFTALLIATPAFADHIDVALLDGAKRISTGSCQYDNGHITVWVKCEVYQKDGNFYTAIYEGDEVSIVRRLHGDGKEENEWMRARVTVIEPDKVETDF